MVENVIQKKYGFMIMENFKSDNYVGWNLEETEIYGRDGFIKEAIEKTRNNAGLIATYATGASKCNIKKLKEISFSKEEQRVSIIYAEIVEEFQNGLCLFQIDNIIFKNKEGAKNKSNEIAEDLPKAIDLFKRTNLNKDQSVVAVFGPDVKKLFRRNIVDCQTQEQKGIYSFIFANKIDESLYQ